MKKKKEPINHYCAYENDYHDSWLTICGMRDKGMCDYKKPVTCRRCLAKRPKKGKKGT